MRFCDLQKTTNPAAAFFRGCKTDAERFEAIANFAADFVCWLYEEDERMKKLEKRIKELKGVQNGK